MPGILGPVSTLNRFILPGTAEFDFTKGGPLDPRITFSRPGDVYDILNGQLTKFGPNVPVLLSDGLSIRPAETNQARGDMTTWGYTSLLTRGAKFQVQGVDLYPFTVSEATSTTQNINQNIYTTAGSYYLAQFMAQRGTGIVEASFSNYSNWLGANGSRAVFDTNAGTWHWYGAAGVSAFMIPVGAGLYLCGVVGQVNAGSAMTNSNVTLSCLMPTGGFVGGEQMVVGAPLIASVLGTQSFPVPIPTIPTTTSAVTRPADSANINGAAFQSVFNAAEGGMVFEADISGGQGDLFVMSANSSIYNGVRPYVYGRGSAIAFYQNYSDGLGDVSKVFPLSSTRLKGGVLWQGGSMTVGCNGATYTYPNPRPGFVPQIIRLIAQETGMLAIKARRLRFFTQRPSDDKFAEWITP